MNKEAISHQSHYSILTIGKQNTPIKQLYFLQYIQHLARLQTKAIDIAKVKRKLINKRHSSTAK